MTIKIELNGNQYGILVEGNCFTAVRYRANLTGNNVGKIMPVELGYFTNLSNAALRLTREEIATSDDIVDLKEFASRISAINKQLTDQIENIPV